MTRAERYWRLATIPGGYALTSLAVAALVRVLPVSRVEAVSVGFLAFFPLYAGLILWAYGTRRLGRLWLGWVGAAALFGALMWMTA